MKRMFAAAAVLCWLSVLPDVRAAAAAIEVPLTLQGHNFSIDNDFIFGLDDTATNTGLGPFDLPGGLPPVFGGDQADFLTDLPLLKDIRTTPTGDSVVVFELRVTFGTPPFDKVDQGLYYNDANGNDAYDTGEDIWLDKTGGTRAVYDANDTQIYDGGDGWTTAESTAGIVEGIYFNDDGDDVYEVGEDIWKNTVNASETSGTYDEFDDAGRALVQDERVYDGGDGWTTADGTIGASVHEIAVSWDNTAAVWTDNNLVASMARKSDGAILVADMTAENLLVLTESTNLLISLSIGAAGNAPPTAVPDSATTRKNVALDGADAIDVLANDFDVDTDPLTLVRVGADDDDDTTTPTDKGGVATIVGGKVEYTPPADYASDIDDPTTYDTFTYTVSDSTAETTATVTVVVFPGDAVSSRAFGGNGAKMKAGTPDDNPAVTDGGLTVTVTITFADNSVPATLDKLELTEIFPIANDGFTFYKIANGAGLGGFDIGGDNPPDTVTGNGEQTAVTFGWATGGRALPAQNSISFTYRLIGPAADATDPATEKSFCTDGDLQCGTLVYRLNSQAPEEADIKAFTTGDDTFVPVDQLANLDVDNSDNGAFYNLVDLRIIFNYQFGGGKFVDLNMLTGTDYADDADAAAKGAEFKATIESMIAPLDVDESDSGAFYNLVDLRIIFNYQFGGGKFVDLNMLTGTEYADDADAAAKAAAFKAAIENMVGN